MAKNQPPLSSEDVKTGLNELMLTGEAKNGVTYEQAFDILEKANEAQMQNIATDYFNFETKGTFHFMFEGMDTAEIDGKVIDVVRLRNREGKCLINGNAVLVNSLRKVTTLPAMVRVVYESDGKSAKGTYKDLKVFVL
jgi:hypothetical protein